MPPAALSIMYATSLLFLLVDVYLELHRIRKRDDEPQVPVPDRP